MNLKEFDLASKFDVRFLMSSSLVLGLLAFSGCKGDSAEELVAAAKMSVNKDANAAAIVQLKSALQLSPSHSEARFLFGEALLRSGKAELAVEEFKKAEELGYAADAVIPALARAMLQAGQAKQLLARFSSTVLTEAPAIADLKSTIAVALLQKDDLAAAKIAVEEALRAQSEHPPSLLLKANMLAGEQDIDAALQVIGSLLKKDPKNVQAWHMSGVLRLRGKGEEAAALADFSHALEIQPTFAPAHQAIYMLKLQNKDLVGAEQQLNRLVKVLPKHSTTLYLSALNAYLKGETKVAREAAQSLTRLAPDSAHIQFLVGLIEYQDGSFAAAQNSLGKALKNHPEFSFVRQLLTKSYLQEGNLEKALATLSPLLSQQNIDVETLTLAGQLHLLMGNRTQSDAYYAAALKLSPDDPRSRAALALSQLSKGNVGSGFAELESIANASADPYVDFALVTARIKQNDLDGALRAVEVWQKKQVDKPYPFNMKGRIYEMKNDVVSARRAHEQAVALDAAYFPSASRLATFDIAERNFDKASKRFDALLKKDPNHVRALLALANIRQRAGASPQEVAAMVANAIDRNPADSLPRLRLIELHRQAGNVRAAIEVAEAADAAIPGNSKILNALGTVQTQDRKYGPALSSFVKLAVLDPRAPLPHLRQAEVYLATGDQPAAKKSLNRALQLAPDYLLAQRALVAVYLLESNHDAALKVARTVEQQRPKEDVGYLLEGDIESSRKHREASIRAYRLALAQGKTSEAAGKLHAELSLAGRSDEADRFADDWLKQQPADSGFLMYLGDRAFGLAQYPVAERRYRELLQFKPDSVAAVNNLAIALHRQKKAEALEMIEKANGLVPDSPGVMASMVTILAGQGKFDRAILVQKRLLELSPNQPRLGLSLAKLYIDAGDKSKALAELKKLNQLGESFPERAEVATLLKTL
ncbi:PEP-CTERM system TPR-repeat protein PrsT [Paucibacter sp. B2R-40]|uniref:XrtA/PEP-CTERM system TPR-repeat protein PrsT n=1 Tax=Paucibacter sp. B2R-40 TaxID=2893554 RepID=UPI0021E3752F|nr:XrtA/PEP-CTERM system TPR-repeat protein PrsT [Paucibacter sp. B2R-40]MCV2355477.1 PEP-CTERM system TPR-repeat protein PrsT [Paucibacter sp. B2R-40]